jgi:hypothetical protein
MNMAPRRTLVTMFITTEYTDVSLNPLRYQRPKQSKSKAIREKVRPSALHFLMLTNPTIAQDSTTPMPSGSMGELPGMACQNNSKRPKKANGKEREYVKEREVINAIANVKNATVIVNGNIGDGESSVKIWTKIFPIGARRLSSKLSANAINIDIARKACSELTCLRALPHCLGRECIIQML